MSAYVFSIQRDGHRYEAVATLDAWRDTTVENKRLELLLQWHDSPHGILAIQDPQVGTLHYVKEFMRYAKEAKRK